MRTHTPVVAHRVLTFVADYWLPLLHGYLLLGGGLLVSPFPGEFAVSPLIGCRGGVGGEVGGLAIRRPASRR